MSGPLGGIFLTHTVCWNSVIWKENLCPQMGCIPLNWSAQRQVPHNAVKS